MTLSGKYSLAGKFAVVTGAGDGIGRAIALVFAEAGEKSPASIWTKRPQRQQRQRSVRRLSPLPAT